MAKVFLFVGCLNRRLPPFPSANGNGIAVFAFDPNTGDCRQLSLMDDIDNPTYLSFDPPRSCLYANSEVAGKEGTVTTYLFDPTSGRLSPINKQPTLGSIAAHNSLSRDGRFLFVANYGEGPTDALRDQSVTIFPILDDGGLGSACGSIAHRGTGPNPERQERPHAHCAVSSPDGGLVVVADLGIDAVLCHRLVPDGSLAPDPAPLRLPPGSGPRQIAFHPSQAFAYVINELSSTISLLSFENRGFRLIESVPTLPASVGAENYPAELQLSRDGRFLYASNRGHDSIAIYAVDTATGRLAAISHCPSGGKTPRSFAIDPSGQWLLVGNQNSDSIALFQMDARNGTLTDTGRRLDVGTPLCVKFGAV